ncbi:MAG: hypothetical protein HN377_07045 [Alphaproteobacteria bacterium]|nr:hypothetical protein [Alphaproteobacteria bacterium]MBT7942966.1 hypothetical protein [Alphaproteobacteria bacterium]
MTRAELWPNSGFRLLDRDDAGRLVVTDNFLRAYLSRPELAPVEEACDAELALYASLVEDPLRLVGAEELGRLTDPDARENYGVLLDFRDRLVEAGSVEACYLSLFGAGDVTLPALFIDHMAHAIVRNVLDDVTDPFQARAGELLFREQSATNEDGAILLGDTEVIGMLAASGGMGNLGRLVSEGGIKPKQVELDVLQPEKVDIYWGRNEDFDTVLDLTFARPGLDALCRVLEAWVAHFLDARVTIQPVQQIADERWVWHVGLDRDSSALLNDLYEGVEVEADRMARVLSLFRLEFEDPTLMRAEIAGRPVYLALSMSADKKVLLKPQNLLVNLPLAREA